MREPGAGQSPRLFSHKDPEHPVDRLEPRTFGRALQRSELLPEGKVFKDQFMMSSACQGERSDEKENCLQLAGSDR
jgi:hypothetical protein